MEKVIDPKDRHIVTLKTIQNECSFVVYVRSEVSRTERCGVERRSGIAKMCRFWMFTKKITTCARAQVG